MDFSAERPALSVEGRVGPLQCGKLLLKQARFEDQSPDAPFEIDLVAERRFDEIGIDAPVQPDNPGVVRDPFDAHGPRAARSARKALRDGLAYELSVLVDDEDDAPVGDLRDNQPRHALERDIDIERAVQ